MHFYFSRILAKNFHILRKRTRQRHQVCNLRVRKNFKRKTGRTRKAFYVSSRAEHFQEIILAGTKTLWLLGNEQEVAGFLAKPFYRSCQHRIPYLQRNALRQKGFFPKKIFLTFFSDLEWRNSGFVAEVFDKGVQNKIHETRGTFLVNLYLEEDTTLYLLMVFLRKIWFAKKLQVRQWGLVRAQWNILKD